jgi:hypothetical protein
VIGLGATEHHRGARIAGCGDLLDAWKLALGEGERPGIDDLLPEAGILDLVHLWQGGLNTVTECFGDVHDAGPPLSADTSGHRRARFLGCRGARLVITRGAPGKSSLGSGGLHRSMV